MSISRLIICDWASTRMRERAIESPGWEDVEQAIRALDNESRNDVYLKPLHASKDTFLGVGGGAGKYILSKLLQPSDCSTRSAHSIAV
jgi:hypothetical protein